MARQKAEREAAALSVVATVDDEAEDNAESSAAHNEIAILRAVALSPSVEGAERDWIDDIDNFNYHANDSKSEEEVGELDTEWTQKQQEDEEEEE